MDHSIDYYKKYIKYKKKYEKLTEKLNQSTQLGGDYNVGNTIVFEKNNKIVNGKITEISDYNGKKMYAVKNNNGDIFYVFDKNIRRQDGNFIKIERMKTKPESKYSIGNIIQFKDIDELTNSERTERVIGTIVRKEYVSESYIYKIKGPRGGKYTVKEDDIIRIVSPKELEEYRQKLITKDFSDQNIEITDHKLEYSDCIENECHETTIEAKIGRLYEISYNGKCDITFICDIIDDNGNPQKRQCKYFMDMKRKNALLKCDNYPTLLHELDILKYIKRQAMSDADLNYVLNDHVIIIDEEQKMPTDSFYYMLNYFKNTMNEEALKALQEYVDVFNVSNFNSDFRGIILPYMRHKLSSNLSTLFNNKNIIKSVFDILYSIYVLHNILDIMHFNCDFNNFCVAKKQNEQDCNYKIGDKYYTMKSKYCIKICNFDQSTKIRKNTDTEEIPNIEISRKQGLCNDQGKCNNYSQKDMFTIISYLLMSAYNQTTDKIDDKMYEIVLLITNNNYGLISAIVKNNIKSNNIESESNDFNLNKDTIFTSFCKYDINSLIKEGTLEFKEHECSDVNIEDLDIAKIIERYIDKYNDELQLEEREQ